MDCIPSNLLQDHLHGENHPAQEAYHSSTPYQEATGNGTGQISEMLSRSNRVKPSPYQNVQSRAFKSGRGNLLNHRAHESGGSQCAANPGVSMQSDLDSAGLNDSQQPIWFSTD